MTMTDDLLAWYHRHRRVLPWREDPTPYHVLLSELMLQQTRVETVIPYFERFRARWPTLAAFAQADEADVMEMWAGLGYYRRARNLLAAARAAVARGGLPSDPALLRELPGIGPYTAGAIAAIAYGVPTPVVDGNVERVVARVFHDERDPTTPAGKRAFSERVAALVPAEGAGDFAQAMMELGATVCVPRNPRCGVCPWHEVCVARAAGDAESLPRKAAKKAPTAVRDVSGILECDGGILVGRRPSDGLLGGLWEPPSRALREGDDPEVTLAGLFADLGWPVVIGPRVGELTHVFTHRRLTRLVVRVQVAGVAQPRPTLPAEYDAVAVLRDDGAGFGLSTLAKKTLAVGRPGTLL
jgi:A/G-specific adenine glycosylase